MTPTNPRPPGSLARRASLLLMILGGVAALMGVAMIAFAPAIIAAQDPETKARLDELRQQVPFDPKLFFAVAGFILLAYGVTALTLGVLVRGGGRATAIVTLVLAALVTLVMTLQVVAWH